MIVTTRTLIRLLALAAIALPCAAQEAWPSKPIHFIVPAAAGGPPDLIARALADRLSSSLSQPVIVENRVGGGQLIGTEAVVRAAPDGHTFLVVSTPHVVNPALRKTMPYDTEKDLQPVSWITSLPLVLEVNASLPLSSVQDLVALAKAKPGQLNMASAGNGGGPHLAGEMFKQLSGASFVHVPYKGSPQATLAVLGGEAAFYFDTPSGALPHVKSGRLKILAVTTLTRSPALPQVPTMAESGFPDFELNVWNGIVAPARVPRPIVDRLQAAVAQALAAPELRARFAALGIETVGSSPEEFGKLISRDLARCRKVAQAAGMSID